MPAQTGVDFVIEVGNEVQNVVASGGGGADTFQLTFEGETTSAIAEDATAATVETELEALSTIDDVVVTENATGDWDVEFQGDQAGQDVELLESTGETGTLSVAISEASSSPNYNSVAAQRGVTLNRSTDEADITSKDSNEFHEGLPTIRSWSIDFDMLIVESDSGLQALDSAFLENRLVHIRCKTPAGNTYSGEGTLSDFNWEGPHDDVFTASGTITGTDSLTKA